MPSNNHVAFIVDTLIDILDADTSWQVVRVFKGDSSADTSKGTIYPYVQGVSFGDGMENGANDGMGEASCEIMYSAKVANDTGGAGLATIALGDATKKIMGLLLGADVEGIAVNNDGTFKTRITAIVIDGHVGSFDNNDAKVRLGIALTVHFLLTRI